MQRTANILAKINSSFSTLHTKTGAFLKRWVFKRLHLVVGFFSRFSVKDKKKCQTKTVVLIKGHAHTLAGSLLG